MSDLSSVSDSVAVEGQNVLITGGKENMTATLGQSVPPSSDWFSLHFLTGRRVREEDYHILDNGANQLTSAAPVFCSAASNGSLMTEGARRLSVGP